MTASRPLFLIGANSHRQWGWRTPRWFGDGCRRRDLLAHELSSTGLGASVPHAVLGEAIRQGCSGTPLGTGKGLLGLWTTPWDGRALWGSSFFVLALVVFLVAVPSRGPFAVLLASWLFSATRALVLNDRRRTQRAARGVIAAVEPGAGRPTPAHTSEKDDPLGLTEPHPARSKLTAPHVHHRVVGRSVASRALDRLPRPWFSNWRRRPESNWGWRFCRPLPYHLATSPPGLNRF